MLGLMFYVSLKQDWNCWVCVMQSVSRVKPRTNCKEGVKWGLQSKGIADKISCYKNVVEDMGKGGKRLESTKQRVTLGNVG